MTPDKPVKRNLICSGDDEEEMNSLALVANEQVHLLKWEYKKKEFN